MDFDGFESFATHLVGREVATVIAMRAGLDHVGAKIEATAKEEIGIYQPAVGPFSAWAPLADSTVADRVAQGFTPNDPLLRTGALRDSISHQVDGLDVAIGSTSDVMVWQELGTATIPPRPVLGPAAVRNERVIQETIGAAVVAGLVGRELIGPGLGYDWDVSSK